jgi:acetyltransferase-like isoleucine patch superfamily enzyme
MRNPLILLLSWCPGALGLLLRQKFYPLFLGHCGRKVLFGRFTKFFHPRRICIGDFSVISDKVILDGGRGEKRSPGIDIGKHAFVGAGTKIFSRGGAVAIGEGSSIGSYCRIVSPGAVDIREGVLLAAFCRVGRVPAGFVARSENDENVRPGRRSIVVGKGSWLGVRCYAAPGVRIGEGAVVGAHTVVTQSLPDYVVAVGRPARILRRRLPDTAAEAGA